MSAKNRKRKTVADDALMTPPEVAGACIGLLDIEDGSIVLEPAAGEGVWLAALHELVGPVHVVANELRQHYETALRAQIEKFASGRIRFGRFENMMARLRCDWVIGNPPYTHAELFVKHGMYHLVEGGHMAYLLRLPFRGTAGRRELFHQYPPIRILVLEERPSFDGEGTDATEYALFHWRRGYQGQTTIDSFSWANLMLYSEDRVRIHSDNAIRRLWAPGHQGAL